MNTSNGLLRLKASIVFARFRWGEGSKKRRESVCTKNARNGAGIGSAITGYPLFLQADVQLLTRHTLSMLVITRSTAIVMVVAVPATVGENDAAAQHQQREQGNQPCDSTEHLKILMVIAVIKPNLFIGCNMRPRLQRPIPAQR
jgi:hypothetical protein